MLKWLCTGLFIVVVGLILWDSPSLEAPQGPEPAAPTHAPIAAPNERPSLDVIEARIRQAAPGTSTGALAAATSSEPVDQQSTLPPVRVLVGHLFEVDSDTPVAGFPLQLRTRAARTVLASVTTDSNGRFETPSLPLTDLSVVHDFDPNAGGTRLWIRPGEVSLVAGIDPEERRFEAHRPDIVLEVDVVTASGDPAANADVHISLKQTDRDSGDPMRLGSMSSTDRHGRARLGLWDYGEISEAHVFAIRGEDEVSPRLWLDDLEDVGRPRLVLGQPAWLELDAVDEFGAPVPDRECRIRSQARDSSGGNLAWVRPHRTDAKGEVRFGPLIPGEYEVVIQNPSIGGQERVPDLVRVTAGETRQVEMVLSSGRLRLAAAGRVVDEHGEPLSNVRVIGLVGPSAIQTKTLANGSFELWSDPIDSLVVSLGLDTESDLYEPTSAEVASGTRALIFTRISEAEDERFRIRAIDARTGAPIENVFASFDRGPGSERWSNGYAPREVFERPVQPGLRVAVGAVGYTSQTFELRRELNRAPDTPPTLTATLEQGLHQREQVVDADTYLPLKGVRFSNLSGDAFTTDADGAVTLVGALWSTFTIEHAGYEPEEWDPEAQVLFPSGPIHLSRER